MKIKKNLNLMVLFVLVGILMEACGTLKQTTSQLSNGVDSIKIEISTKVSANYIMLTGKNRAIVSLKDSPKYLLSVPKTQKLKSLAEELFVKKTKRIILSEEKSFGRTSHPIFTISLYHNGKVECTRYDMGDEVDGITRCTTKNIRYSSSFREFMFSVFRILD